MLLQYNPHPSTINRPMQQNNKGIQFQPFPRWDLPQLAAEQGLQDSISRSMRWGHTHAHWSKEEGRPLDSGASTWSLQMSLVQ